MESARAVEQRMAADLLATKKVVERDGKAAAVIYRNFVVLAANREGMLPVEWEAKYGRVSVQKGVPDVAGEAVQQDAKPGFFSALSRGIEGLNAKALTARGWKDSIKGLTNKGIAKQDEIDWTGLTEWLDMQPGKVTQEQVAAFLAGNGVKVEDVTLGTTEPEVPSRYEHGAAKFGQ